VVFNGIGGTYLGEYQSEIGKSYRDSYANNKASDVRYHIGKCLECLTRMNYGLCLHFCGVCTRSQLCSCKNAGS